MCYELPFGIQRRAGGVGMYASPCVGSPCRQFFDMLGVFSYCDQRAACLHLLLCKLYAEAPGMLQSFRM